jgi:hypothetical protein
MAQVKGDCANCHTMHNSQNTNTQVFAGTGAAWNPAVLTGGIDFSAQGKLLKSDCVGCHSSTDNSTTIKTDVSGNQIPIVYNQGGYPAQPLAGGNFANVKGAGGSQYGHNVLGIANKDAIINNLPAPGHGIANCANSCHFSLAPDNPALTPTFNFNGVPQGQLNGCQGCHTRVGHHKANDTTYRYLAGHGGAMAVGEVDGGTTSAVGSFESADWEQVPSNINHNFYKAQTSDMQLDSIGRFCAGCHGEFHAMGVPNYYDGSDNGGDDNTDDLITAHSASPNPWLRHPTNVNIPMDPASDYIILNGASYEPKTPVAQDPSAAATKDIINRGDQVMCLSCHRAHASDQPDSLRFDYSKMVAHTALPVDQDTGCFFCHRGKDTN